MHFAELADVRRRVALLEVEATAEATVEATAEATVEATAEATVEATAEATVEGETEIEDNISPAPLVSRLLR